MPVFSDNNAQTVRHMQVWRSLFTQNIPHEEVGLVSWEIPWNEGVPHSRGFPHCSKGDHVKLKLPTGFGSLHSLDPLDHQGSTLQKIWSVPQDTTTRGVYSDGTDVDI